MVTRRGILAMLSCLVALCALYYFQIPTHALDATGRQQVPLNNLKPGQEEPAFRRHIVAIGDLHGDLPNAKRVLTLGRVIDESGVWSGEVDAFVQTGDIIDRGDDTIALFSFMEELRSQAHGVGGEVVSHLGNHEWMNLVGDWRYVYPSEIKTFGGIAARQKELATGKIGRAWAANYSTASRVPLHPILGISNTDYIPGALQRGGNLSHAAISFVHGGLAPSYPELTPFPSAINALSASFLRKVQHQAQFATPHPPGNYPALPPTVTEREADLLGANGPVWWRDWALGKEEDVCPLVGGVLEKTGVRRMIMGHTPDFERIVSRCDGRIIIIDTGISHAYNGALSALDIDYTLHPTDEKDKWLETEIVTALYVSKPSEVLVNDKRFVYMKAT